MHKRLFFLAAALGILLWNPVFAESRISTTENFRLLNEDSVSLSLSAVEALPGETVCLQVQVDSNFSNLVTLQFTISWDTTQLEFVEATLNPTFPPNFISIPILGLDNTGSGFMVMAWGLGDFDTYPDGISRDPGYEILELCLTVKPGATGFLPVDFTDDIAIQEAANSDLEVCNISFRGGGVQTPSPVQIVGLQLGEGRGPVGSRLGVPVTVTEFTDICTLELGISWDNSRLQYAGVDSLGLPGMEQGQFTFVNSNNLLLDWACAGNGLSLSAGDTLFIVYFELLGPAGDDCTLDFIPESTLAVNADGETLETELQNGYVYMEGISQASDVSFTVQDADVLAGGAFCTDITVVNFSDITNLQFTMRWDTSRLEFESLETGNLTGLAGSLNLATVSEGFFRMAWFSGNLPDGSTLEDGALLFSLCFTAKSRPGPAAVRFSGIPLAIGVGVEGSQLPAPAAFEDGEAFIYNTEVWPGDADADGRVGEYDLLPLGLAMGATGPQRPAGSTAWEGQLALSWETTIAGSNTNTVHSDTDGNGAISPEDTLAINLNWGLEVPPIQPPSGLGRVGVDVPILVRPDTLPASSILAFDILLGTQAVPAEEVYGLAFTVVASPSIVAPTGAFVQYEDSWLGTVQNGLLGMYRYFGANARLPMALTRTDGNNTSGSGRIARIFLPLRNDLPNGLLELPFTIEGVRLIDKDGVEIPTISLPTTALIDNVVSVGEASLEKRVQVFPVPARERVFVRADGLQVRSATLFSPTGQELNARLENGVLSVRGLPAGLYRLQVETEEGVVWKVVVVGE